jgi:hypothetical protein
MFEPCHQERMRRPGLENAGLGDREHNLIRLRSQTSMIQIASEK